MFYLFNTYHLYVKIYQSTYLIALFFIMFCLHFRFGSRTVVHVFVEPLSLQAPFIIPSSRKTTSNILAFNPPKSPTCPSSIVSGRHHATSLKSTSSSRPSRRRSPFLRHSPLTSCLEAVDRRQIQRRLHRIDTTVTSSSRSTGHHVTRHTAPSVD